MGHWETVAGGEPIDINKYVDYRDYATTAERDAASVGWDSSEKFRICTVAETGYFYYWNGASWQRFPASGGSGAPDDASYVTINAEDELSAETLHKNITGDNLHDPKIHTHVEANVTDLDHDAQKIKGKTVDDTAIGNDKILVYKAGGIDNIVYEAKPSGGGDMYKTTYDANDDGVVEDSDLLEGSTKAQVQTHTPANHITRHISGGADPFTSAQLIEAIVKRVQESSGPTTLTVGNVSDGQYLKRSASTIIGAAGTAQSYKLAPSYTIYKVGGNYTAMDSDGNKPYSDGSFESVFESCVNSLIGNGYGGWIHIKAGAYTVDDELNITGADMDGVHLRISGEANATILNKGFNGDMFNVVSVGADRTFTIEIDHLLLDGKKASYTGNGINFTDVNRSSIHNCLIESIKGYGVLLDTSNIASYYNWIHHNQIRNMDGEGIRVQNTGSKTIDCNWITDNNIGTSTAGSGTANGIHIVSSSGAFVLSRNFINQVGYYGMYLESAGVHKVLSNHFDRCGRHALYNKTSQSVIAGNMFFESSYTADNTYSDIYMDDTARNCMIYSSMFWGYAGNKPKYNYEESSTGTNYPNKVLMMYWSGAQTSDYHLQGGSTTEVAHCLT